MRYNRRMKKSHIIRIAVILIVGLGTAAFIANNQIQRAEPSYQKPIKRPDVVSKNFGGAFTLTNHLGQSVTHQDFDNQYRLIYFGFTYCPAICPTELQRISTILKNIEAEKSDLIQPIFITIDPERDTVETMKNYVELFHPRLTGLTGTSAQIDVAKKAYKIYAAKVQDETMSDYTMDHSSFIYFIGPDNSLIRIFKLDDKIDDMTDFIQGYMSI